MWTSVGRSHIGLITRERLLCSDFLCHFLFLTHVYNSSTLAFPTSSLYSFTPMKRRRSQEKSQIIRNWCKQGFKQTNHLTSFILHQFRYQFIHFLIFLRYGFLRHLDSVTFDNCRQLLAIQRRVKLIDLFLLKGWWQTCTKISFEEFYKRYVWVCKYSGKTEFSIYHRQFFVKDFSQQKSSQPFCSISHRHGCLYILR